MGVQVRGRGGVHESFRPAPGFLRYLKLFFWLIYLLIIAGLTILGISITFQNFWVGMILLLALFIIMILTGIIAYLAIHLRYDTTWYVMTDRSLRIRRGTWIIHETTNTFENIQNVNVSQGPVQRYFGISDVVVKTAGGGRRFQKQRVPGHKPRHHRRHFQCERNPRPNPRLYERIGLCWAGG